MTRTTTLRRRFAVPLALLIIMATGAAVPGVPARPAMAAPGSGNSGTGSSDNGDEGQTPLVRDVLAEAGRGFADARAKLEASKTRQLELGLQLRRAEEQLAVLSTEVSQVAAVAYRTGRLSPASALLNSVSPDAFLERAAAVELITVRDDQKLQRLNAARRDAAQAKAAIDAEAREQQRQLAIMARKKQDAEQALVEVGGEATGGYVVTTSPVAKAAPRNPDGSWPPQSCTINDPTTSGCITARTLNALQEAKKAGFTRFVSCFRPGGPFEHPKGRACDFSAEKSGFGGVAQGDDKIYGNNLAAFFVRNGDRLGILYVIWFKQIWFPATGWRAYHSGHGDPSSDHTNHVHLSLL